MVSKVTLKSKLLLLVLLPFLVLGYFTIDKISKERQVINGMEAVKAKMSQLEKISELTHELQKERDFAIKFMSYPLISAEGDLIKQLSITDSIEAHYRAFLIVNKYDTTDFVYLNEFQKTRESLTGYSFGPDEVEGEYEALISHYLDLVATFGSEINTPLTKEEMKAYLALAEAKEGLGKIRNMINRALVFGMFQQLEYGMFSGEKGTFEYNLKAFMKHSPEEFRMRFEMDLQGGSMINTLDIINYCFENETNDLSDFTSTDWWISATGTINHFHELELFVLGNIKASLTSQENELEERIYSLYLMLSVVLFGVLILVSLIAKSIAKQLQNIEFVAQELNLGKTDVNVKISSNDEIGKLAKSFNVMAQMANEMADAADNIGKGNYDAEFNKRSDEDVLGAALINMRDSLKSQTNTLQENIKQLEEANKYKSDFLANMSHELRTPLNSMLILTSLLLENNQANLNEEQVKFIEVIKTSGTNLLELINDILDLSKIEAGKLDVEITEVDLFSVVSDLFNLFQPIANENDLSFNIIQNGLIPKCIESDELRLGQILKNLISNSMKFTPSKGEVTVSLEFKKDILSISVSDSGIGIPKEKQESIFEAFNQADGSTSRKYGGTGLGLSITSTLVNLLNGKISLDSKEGEGTVFKVEFPLQSNENLELKELPSFRPIKRIEKKESPEKPVELSKVIVAEQKIQSSDLPQGAILLIDSDISNVFKLASHFSSLTIDEAGNKEELIQKDLSSYHKVLLNKESFSNEDFAELKTELERNSEKLIFVGLGEKVDSLDNINALKKYLLH